MCIRKVKKKSMEKVNTTFKTVLPFGEGQDEWGGDTGHFTSTQNS